MSTSSLFILFLALSSCVFGKACSPEIQNAYGCLTCVGDGPCCGQGNVTDPDTGTKSNWCATQCLPKNYVCCGCNPRWSSDPDISCTGCGNIYEGGVTQFCNATNSTANPQSKLDWYCSNGLSNLPSLVVFLIGSLFIILQQ